MKGDTMRNTYFTNQAADCFATGFPYKGQIYGFLCDAAYIREFSVADKTSKKHGRVACLRLRFTANDKREIVKQREPLCSVEQFNAMRREGENNGHIFERLMREKYDATPCKSRAWWEGADFEKDAIWEVKGRNGKTIIHWETVQAKFEGGTFCTAKQCREHRMV